MGVVLGADTALSLSTTETGNLVQNTYDYIGAGVLTLYAKASASTVKCNLFVAGSQILRGIKIPFTGTAGTLSTADNKVTAVKTLGGRVELTFVATTGTPTIDYQLVHEGIPMGSALSRFMGRR